jgi:hypothetical protein
MRVTFFIILLLLVAFYAFKRGDKPEHIAAAIFISMLIFDAALHMFLDGIDVDANKIHLFIDIIMWISLVALALKANRLWTLLVAALQTVSLSSHAVRIFNLDLHPQAYGFIQVAGFYPMLLILAIGTWRHQQRRIRSGGDPSWSL